MPIVDDRGRLAGRVNVLDAIVALVIVVLIPVAYGAYLLFRSPQPKLLSIGPDKLYQGPNLRIDVMGTNLRPFMRVSFNSVQGRTFMIANTKWAQVELPTLDPGVYDVVLYDYMQEVDRLPKALTILPLAPTPTVEMEVAGSFKQITQAMVERLKAGTKFPPSGEPLAQVLAVAAPRPSSLRLRSGEVTLGLALPDQLDLPATLSVKCFTQSNPDGSVHCAMAGPSQASAVAPDSFLTLAGPAGWLTFQIDEVHLASAPSSVQARVRFVASREVIARVRGGDVDVSLKARAAGHSATIVSIGTARAASSGEAGEQPPIGGGRVLDVVIRVPIELTPAGWIYKEQTLKAGAPFAFETAAYTLRGEVVDVELPPMTLSPAMVR